MSLLDEIAKHPLLVVKTKYKYKAIWVILHSKNKNRVQVDKKCESYHPCFNQIQVYYLVILKRTEDSHSQKVSKRYDSDFSPTYFTGSIIFYGSLTHTAMVGTDKTC